MWRLKTTRRHEHFVNGHAFSGLLVVEGAPGIYSAALAALLRGGLGGSGREALVGVGPGLEVLVKVEFELELVLVKGAVDDSVTDGSGTSDTVTLQCPTE